MTAAILIPIKVFGIGFIISMGISVLIKFLLDVIKLFSKNSTD
ncbi:hypothetical protein [Anaerocolumna sp. MB42-C2]|nr:hypothetical protein [Anaerocolumna sp. MB42-C2]WMJ88979.1 hypothetical protein RBU59_05515 [Anaerocolumna sp. MB42-C2]